MNKWYAMLALAALLATTATASFADDMQQGAVEETAAATCEDCWEKGTYTTDHPVMSRVVTSPLRVVGAAVGAPIGAIKGMFVGAKEGVVSVNDATMGHTDTDESYAFGNHSSEFLKTVVMAPVSLVGSVVAMPVGGTVGLLEGTMRGATSGFMMPDQF